jgi:hypothetical protein
VVSPEVVTVHTEPSLVVTVNPLDVTSLTVPEIVGTTTATAVTV